MMRKWSAFALVLSLAVFFCPSAEARSITIGVPIEGYWWACKSADAAVKVAEAEKAKGYDEAMKVFAAEGCEQMSEPVTAFAHKVVWHGDIEQNHILKVVEMTFWNVEKNQLEVGHQFWALTVSEVIGSGIEEPQVQGMLDGDITLAEFNAPQVSVGDEVTVQAVACKSEDNVRAILDTHKKSGMKAAIATFKVKSDEKVCGIWTMTGKLITQVAEFSGLSTPNGEETWYVIKMHVELMQTPLRNGISLYTSEDADYFLISPQPLGGQQGV